MLTLPHISKILNRFLDKSKSSHAEKVANERTNNSERAR